MKMANVNTNNQIQCADDSLLLFRLFMKMIELLSETQSGAKFLKCDAHPSCAMMQREHQLVILLWACEIFFNMHNINSMAVHSIQRVKRKKTRVKWGKMRRLWLRQKLCTDLVNCLAANFDENVREAWVERTASFCHRRIHALFSLVNICRLAQHHANEVLIVVQGIRLYLFGRWFWLSNTTQIVRFNCDAWIITFMLAGYWCFDFGICISKRNCTHNFFYEMVNFLFASAWCCNAFAALFVPSFGVWAQWFYFVLLLDYAHL